MSLNIEKGPAGGALALSGRLDTVTAPELEAVLTELLPAAEALTLNLEGLDYISSAGLRVILRAHKAMSRKGGLKLTNVPEAVMEVFEITGFTDFLTIER